MECESRDTSVLSLVLNLFQAAEEQICDRRTFCDCNPLTVRRFMKDRKGEAYYVIIENDR